MSTEGESQSGQKSTDSASLREEMRARLEEEEEEAAIRVTAELLEHQQTLADNLRKIQAEPTAYDADNIVHILNQLNNYFRQLSNAERPYLTNIVILADCFMLINYIHFAKFNKSMNHLFANEFYATRSVTLLRDLPIDDTTVIIMMLTYFELGIIKKLMNKHDEYAKNLYKVYEIYFAYTKVENQVPCFVPLSLTFVYTWIDVKYLVSHIYSKALSFVIKTSDFVDCKTLNMNKLVPWMHELLEKTWKLVLDAKTTIGWAIEVLHMAEHFIISKRFVESKHYLCAVSFIIDKYHKQATEDAKAIKYAKASVKYNKEKEEIQMKKIKFLCDILWVKYGLVLMNSSRQALIQVKAKEEKEGKVEEGEKEEREKKAKENAGEEGKPELEGQTRPDDRFAGLLLFTDMEDLETFARITPDNYITSYKDVHVIFLKILRILNELQKDEIILTSVEFRADIAHYTALTYKYLAFYEGDETKREKLQHQRIKILQDCLQKLDKADVLDSLFLWLELGLIYSSLVDTWIHRLKEDEVTDEKWAEMNSLGATSLEYLNKYLSEYNRLSTAGDTILEKTNYWKLTHKKLTQYQVALNI